MPDTSWFERTHHAATGRRLYLRQTDFREVGEDRYSYTLWFQVRNTDGTVLDTATLDEATLPPQIAMVINDDFTEIRIETFLTGDMRWLMRLPPVDDGLGWTRVARDEDTGREVFLNMTPEHRKKGADKEIQIELRTADGTVLTRNTLENLRSTNSGLLAKFDDWGTVVSIRFADESETVCKLEAPLRPGEPDKNPRWQLVETHEPTGRQIFQRTLDFSVRGNNEGSMTDEIDVREADGTVIVGTFYSIDWEYSGQINAKFQADCMQVRVSGSDPDRERKILDLPPAR